MAKSLPLLLGYAWALVAVLGSGCHETSSPHRPSEVGVVYDYIVRQDDLLRQEGHDHLLGQGRARGPLPPSMFSYVVPARFHRFPEETDFSNFAARSEKLGRNLDAGMALTVRAECLATPNASPEWQALRTQVNGPGTAANAILLAFSARCDGRDGRHYYYVERTGVEGGRPSRYAQGNVYQVYQGRVEREIPVWIT
ncbi:hypothetical protein [Hymenobacter sp. B1770]|uniref:hypothetical protein n=1 Tax=Hymenobacter sp. B1770 TaxID=1718788 RepID=UPI003CEB202E